MAKKHGPPPLIDYTPQLEGDVAAKTSTSKVHTPTCDKRSDSYGNSQTKTPKGK